MNRINLICLGVADIEKSLLFYKNIGFKTYEQGSRPAIVFFDTQGTKLELFPLEGLAEDIDPDNPPETAPGKFGGITLAINMKSEKEVDDFIELVRKSGGTVVKKPRKLLTWDGYSGYFRDLDGYYWEVAYGKNWKFDENDMLIID
ncbi:VOC family protein [Breznakiella homolactica]|uniref:VOC family protein n=1 Tax=Breznakiella homolactica TaxID=2798577 RepID=A0A7T8B7U4_9SPIR|nr:VOC family protein [Breznakiella homolactica]QQO07894.1 VOC family protein [Breznakiella homolactica]